MMGMLAATLCGCGTLRWAPSEAMKQNSYLHHRTTEAMALKARQKETSPALQKLSSRAVQQSEAAMAYAGLPRTLPATESIDEILGGENEAITRQAQADAASRADVWEVADNVLELGLALAGVIGGVYGTRAVKALQLARQKSRALQEVVRGNELFKEQHSESRTFFKRAHAQQSSATRSPVAQMK